MHAHTSQPTARPTWPLRAGVLLAVVSILAPMATLTAASVAQSSDSAIPQSAVARILNDRPGATTATTTARAGSVAIPRTAPGAQLAWLLSEVNGGSATLTKTEVQAHVAASFMDDLPAHRIVKLLKQATDTYAPIRLARYAGFPFSPSALALVETRNHRQMSIELRVDTSDHHRITGLNIDDLLPRTR
jgi:hypothetical protein